MLLLHNHNSHNERFGVVSSLALGSSCTPNARQDCILPESICLQFGSAPRYRFAPGGLAVLAALTTSFCWFVNCVPSWVRRV